LKSVFSLQASNMESEAASALEYTESIKLYEVLTGKHADKSDLEHSQDSLSHLLDKAYTKSEQAYKEAFRANAETIKQLNAANSDLSKAQIQLKSLQLGLSAANAAALAS